MKKLILIIGMMLLGAPLSFAQNGHDLFQKALQKERAEGNLEDVLFAKRSGTSVEEQNIELWRISVDGGAPWRLGALAMEGLDHVRVHPDGRRIAFTAGQDKYEIWVMEYFLPEDEGTQ